MFAFTKGLGGYIVSVAQTIVKELKQYIVPIAQTIAASLICGVGILGYFWSAAGDNVDGLRSASLNLFVAFVVITTIVGSVLCERHETIRNRLMKPQNGFLIVVIVATLLVSMVVAAIPSFVWTTKST